MCTVAVLKPRRKGTEERERTMQAKSAMRAFKPLLEFLSAQSDWVLHHSFVLLFIQEFGLGAERANRSRARDTGAGDVSGRTKVACLRRTSRTYTVYNWLY